MLIYNRKLISEIFHINMLKKKDCIIFNNKNVLDKFNIQL